MSDHSIEQLSAFLREIDALAKTELPLDLGIEGPPSTISESLEDVEEALTSRVERGQPIADAIRDEPSLPEPLRGALRCWARCEDATIALDMLGTTALNRQQYALSIGHAMMYPLLVLLLSYVGLMMMCLLIVPTIESIYEQLNRPPGTGLLVMRNVRQLVPIWGPALPASILALLFWWRRRSPRLCLPGVRSSIGATQHAELAGRLAQLVDGGLPVDEALQVLGPLSDGLESSAEKSSGQAPLLRWAIKTDGNDPSRTGVLRFVAKMYRQKAQQQAAYWRVLVPTVLGLFIGSIFVLGYGLGLFMPLVQLLKDIALPGGV